MLDLFGDTITAPTSVPAKGVLNAASRKAVKTKHGMTGTPTHGSWRSMFDRCFNPNKKAYSDYGGRGIGVCERWRKFENFFADMGPRPPGKTLDRRDVNGDYEPGNCRWATNAEQSRNRRTNVLWEAFGQKKTLADWALDPRCVVCEATLATRIYTNKFNLMDALTLLPLNRGKGRRLEYWRKNA